MVLTDLRTGAFVVRAPVSLRDTARDFVSRTGALDSAFLVVVFVFAVGILK